MMKRLMVGLVVIAVALGGMGLLTARAQDETPTAWLGVGIVDSDEGVTVTQVSADSPADAAGLREGDVIEAVDGTAVELSDQLVEVIGGHAVGDEVTLTISWRGKSRDVKATLAERPTVETQEFSMPSIGMHHSGVSGVLNMLGLELSLSDEGVVVDSIAENSPLIDAGLQAGDVITAINGEALDQQPLRALLKAITGSAEDKTLTLTVLRSGEEVSVELDLSALDLSDLSFGMGMSINGDEFSCCQRSSTRLGVGYQTITADLQAEKSLAVDQGALVMEVDEDSPAAEAGVQVDDIITAVNDEPVDAEHSLRNRLSDYEAGDIVDSEHPARGRNRDRRGRTASGPHVGYGWYDGQWHDGRYDGLW